MHIIIGEMKSQFFIGIPLWVSCHCIHQAYCQLYIFSLHKINKNRKFPRQHLSLGNHWIQIPGNPFWKQINLLVLIWQGFQQKEIFRQTTVHLQNKKYKTRFSQSMVSILFTLLNNNLFWCRHLFSNSDFLYNKFLSSRDWMM